MRAKTSTGEAPKTDPPQTGPLLVIGGHEDREGKKTVLREFAERAGGGRVVVASVASHEPEGYFEQYDAAFTDLGLKDLAELYIQTREEAFSPKKLAILEGATAVFFTGGDQLRITSMIGRTPIFERILKIRSMGGLVGGTSAGASVVCETMLVSGTGDASHRIGDLKMAPGLGFLQGVIVDQHFAERGRMGRILGAVAQNPRILGIGIDEDTAILVEGERFRVIGEGAVTVLDGGETFYTNAAEERTDHALSVFGARLHVLSAGDRFDLTERRPSPPEN